MESAFIYDKVLSNSKDNLILNIRLVKKLI